MRHPVHEKNNKKYLAIKRNLIHHNQANRLGTKISQMPELRWETRSFVRGTHRCGFWGIQQDDTPGKKK